jgi:hypothetical protein
MHEGMALVRAAAMVVACAGGLLGCSAPPDMRESCTRLGWVCGFDDFGHACGTCGAGQTCNHGACVPPDACVPACGLRTCGGDNGCGGSCGSCRSDETCGAAGACVPLSPTDHTLASGASPLFNDFYGVPFSVPVPASVGYAAQTTTGDTWDVGIFTASDWAVWMSGGTGARAYAFHMMTSIQNDAAALPAGSYYLGFHCRNLVQRCAVTSYAVVARY